MAMIQQYRMVAAAGKVAELQSALTALAAAVRARPGCESVDIYADVADASAFLFIEEWHSREDQKKAGRALGREAFAAVMAAAEGRPAGAQPSAGITQSSRRQLPSIYQNTGLKMPDAEHGEPAARIAANPKADAPVPRRCLQR